MKDNLETLGIVFTSTIEENYKHNFESRINNLTTTLNILKQRYLTIKGKITILNNLALAPLIYVSSVIDTPEKAIKEVDTIIQNFIWEGKTAQISKNTLIQTIENGGLKLCDFKTKVKSLKLSWVKRLVENNNAKWKVRPNTFTNTTIYLYILMHIETN